jgi:hypothetical protein
MAERGIAVRDVDVEREPLPFAAASFDRVVATEILQHLASPSLFLSECRRVLRPGGALYLSTPNVVNLRGRARAIRGRSPQSHRSGTARPPRMSEGAHRREYAPDEVSRLLGAVGLKVGGLHTWTPTRADGGRGAGTWLAPLVNRLPGLGGTIFATASPLSEPGAAGAADQARLAPETRYLEARSGASATLAVRIANLGTAAWDPGSAPGGVGLGAHLLDPDGRLLDRDLARGPLPHPVGPGEEIATELTFRTPAGPGVFLVELDLVREGEHWFGDDGSPTARVVLRVVA